jgi:hypothetical protein
MSRPNPIAGSNLKAGRSAMPPDRSWPRVDKDSHPQFWRAFSTLLPHLYGLIWTKVVHDVPSDGDNIGGEAGHVAECIIHCQGNFMNCPFSHHKGDVWKLGGEDAALETLMSILKASDNMIQNYGRNLSPAQRNEIFHALRSKQKNKRIRRRTTSRSSRAGSLGSSHPTEQRKTTRRGAT